MNTKIEAQVSEAPAPVSSFSDRLVSLDVYRGVTIAGMILVTDPGTYSAVYWPLVHAAWNGATPTDMIFPSFLFIVGVSITLSFATRMERGAGRRDLAWHVLRRSAIIFFLGLLVNGFPDYNLHTIRIPGILQRIALCYLGGSFLYLWTAKSAAKPGRRSILFAGVTAAILALYWALLKLVPVPGFGAGRLDSYGNLPAYIDRAVFGLQHLWPYGLTPGVGVTYDPEGILSTLPALTNVLIGILAGEWIRSKHSGRRKALMLIFAGAVLALSGWLLNPLLVINKRIWTSTFVLLSGGVSLLVFALCYWIIDLRRSRWWTPPALVFGTNAILAFALSSVLTTLSDRIHVPVANGPRLSLHQWGDSYLFATWLSPVHASLAYAITIVLLNMVLIFPLYRKRIFLRV
jgi:predicted acyltransferase